MLLLMKDHDRLVYSTDTGRVCAECQKPVADCVCVASRDKILGDGAVRVSRESKGRKGKTVTIITGLPLPHTELKKLEKALKARCGSGGTTKDGVIEIQGDVRDLVLLELQKRGFSVKVAGG